MNALLSFIQSRVLQIALGHYVLGTVPSGLHTLSSLPGTIIDLKSPLLTSFYGGGNGSWRWINGLLKAQTEHTI